MLNKLKQIIEPSESLLKKYKKQIKKINSLEPYYKELSDDELKAHFKKYYNEPKDSEEILFNIFAIIRESSSRVLNLRHYDVQLIGGLVLNEGNIAEMKTGEGKTLVSTCPAIYNTRNKKKVHIITVNEYLAKRDYELNKPLFDFLGISSSYISGQMGQFQKRLAYQSSIIYGTNSEFGFDYLRDHMTTNYSDVLQRDLNFAIVDEVDSVLIDEARTPLIISGTSDLNTDFLQLTNKLVQLLKKDTDFDVDLKTQQISLNNTGIDKAESFFNLENLYAVENGYIVHYLNQSLKAHHTMRRDKDYIVNDGKIEIIDQFTGRISEGRRYSNSLHQAIEVKEGVEVKKETVTKATITYQNYFRLYNKLSGMTGTAYTEKEELLKVYNMHTIVIPTNKEIKRIDDIDLIFPTQKHKIEAIVKKVKEIHSKGQPILIGTPTIEESEIYHKALQDGGITHSVLNAKNHEHEAAIIEQAGQINSVTIATNMAGRGTDIKLGDGVEALGGLYIIGTSKNENRRIDNQLRGRAGRQGDNGYTQFYLSLEDEIMRRFGADKMKKIIQGDKDIEENGIGTKFLTKIFENAQRNLEGMNADSRKNLLEYDSVLSTRRKIVYAERLEVLLEKDAINLYKEFLDNYLNYRTQDDFTSVCKAFYNGDKTFSSIEELRNEIISDVDMYISEGNTIHMNDIVRRIFLNNIDEHWIRFLDALDNIKQGIHLQAYGQQNPIRTYERRAEEEFEVMRDDFANVTVIEVFKNLKSIHENSVNNEEGGNSID